VSSRESTVLIADLPDHSGIEARDPGQAANLVSRFHQIVGECVYPFGGTISDTIGSIVIAELEDTVEALEAFENLGRRIEAESLSTPAIGIRAVLNHGEVHDRDFSLAGRAVQNGLGILDSLQKNQMLVSEEVLRIAGRAPGSAGFLELGGTQFFALPTAPAEGVAEEPLEPSRVATSSGADPKGPASRSSPVSLRKILLIAAAAVVALVLVGAGIWLGVRKGEQDALVAASGETVSSEARDERIAVAVGSIAIEPGITVPDDLLDSAVLLLEAILDSAPSVRVMPGAANRIGAGLTRLDREREGEDATVPGEDQARVVPWVESSGRRLQGQPSRMGQDVWDIVEPAVSFAGEQLRFPVERLLPKTEEARQAFSAAVRAEGPASLQRAERLAVALERDSEFLPGWWWIHRAELEGPEAAELQFRALRSLSRLLPEDVDLARALGRGELERGSLAEALSAFARVRSREADDGESTGIFGLAALAAHRQELFSSFVEEGHSPRLHSGDFAVSEGRIDEGVREYYVTQPDEPENHYLSFKIGRIAVLRRSPQIAALELEKLEAAGAEPMASLMRAYVAADRGERSTAERELGPVIESPRWEDSVWFHAAEIYALLRDERRALSALERSVERGEPMMQAIPRNPLFRYLFNEPRFREAVRRLLERQREIAETLRHVT
jgi:tetratricopeptide (TPR) repeat protein